ncbi:CBS domain-containing protein [Salinihabitans flavidus]|uniref:CBS domain-containing protein n=1 Tax=Salinihabitans flavidus TaxID=569882 RepID=A0A1H8PIJ7_9RHOB|nr:DUF294 nucleotidyltransferase-like domain-containing protein [Salinihabitans flavidus]SEO41735.1 CBS domain-containing protein [Salinihabitans flavidus]
MPLSPDQIVQFLHSVHPYDALPPEELRALAPRLRAEAVAEGEALHAPGDTLPGLYIVQQGRIGISDARGAPFSELGPRNSFGERGLMQGGRAATGAAALTDAVLLLLPAAEFHRLMGTHDVMRRFFERGRRAARPRGSDLATSRVETLMSRAPLTCPPNTPARDAAQMMRDAGTSSICVTEDGRLIGIVTTRDLASRVLAEGRAPGTAVQDIMTPDPLTLPPSAIGSDVLHAMMERRIGHLPITSGGRLVGMVTQTDLTRFQAVSSGELVAEAARAASVDDLARTTARIPRLLVQLVAGGNRHEVTTRLITDITDTVTRRLLGLAEERLGPAPVPYLWLACGSQGRQEQTGISDQDNCLILDDSVSEAQRTGYFADLAGIVCDGLNACGYVHCPGDMMASNPRWRQPLSVWRGYFDGWIRTPSPEAQMLASVMFDLRPIGGARALFDGLHAQTLRAASANSIFVAHMIGNALKHTPPLGLLRGFATLRSGEHRNHLDMKLNGVVPVTDLARIYALQGRIGPVNTRARLEAAADAGVLSEAGARDLLDAYDLIAETRLTHQAARVNHGAPPDNFLAPSELSDFERSHLRDAFVVVKTMQSALGHGRGMPL